MMTASTLNALLVDLDLLLPLESRYLFTTNTPPGIAQETFRFHELSWGFMMLQGEALDTRPSKMLPCKMFLQAHVGSSTLDIKVSPRISQ